jgi:hypothetical protein
MRRLWYNDGDERTRVMMRARKEGEKMEKSRRELEVEARKSGLFVSQITKIVVYPDGQVITCEVNDLVRGEGYVVGYYHPVEKKFRWC